MITDGSKVSIEYTLTLDDGSVADTNVGDEPLQYVQGQKQILPALERELVGLGAEDTKKVSIQPADGYGDVDPAAVQIVDHDVIPEAARHAGTMLVAEDENGAQMQVSVREVRDDKIVIDLNHPLAGQILHFDVKVLAVE